MKNKYNIINFRPILFIAVAVLIAVATSLTSIYFSVLVSFIVILALTILGLLFLVVIILTKTKKYLITLTVSQILFLIVSLLFTFRVDSYNNASIQGEKYFDGNIYKISKVYTDEYDNLCQDLVIKGKVDSKTIKAKITVKNSNDLYVGCKITFKGTFLKNGVNIYNLSEKIYYSINDVAFLDISGEIDGLFNKIKFKILSNLKSAFPNYYSVCYAMLTGDTSYINLELLNNFRFMGIAHVFAVSGLHIGIIYLTLNFIFDKLKANKILRLIITFIALFLYVWFCGFSPSCLRAFIIVYIISISKALYEKVDRLTSLSLSFIIVLLINPLDFYTIGFKLSFAVYSGIVFLTKPISKFLSTFCFQKMADFLAPYLSAFLASLPLLIDTFGYASLFSTLFNILLVPVLSFIYVCVFFISFISLIFPFYNVLAIIPNLTLEILMHVTNFINANMFLIEGFRFSYSSYSYYLIGILNAKFINVSKNLMLILTLGLIIIFILSIIYLNININLAF